MIYVFDNSPLSTLFKNYYRGRFPSLWEKFDALVDADRLMSTREVLKEINGSSIEALRDWAKSHGEIFSTPTAEEGALVAQIFAINHFQHNIGQKKLYKGGFNADVFVVGKAGVIDGTVVTMEEHRPNAAKIPNRESLFSGSSRRTFRAWSPTATQSLVAIAASASSRRRSICR